MKMTGPQTADSVFGQMLICLRMSKLDYMVKETPYSGYVTIRKKFVKNFTEEHIEKENVEQIVDLGLVENIKKENTFLKDKVNEMERNFAIIKVEHDETELKLVVLEKDKATLEEEIEESFCETRELKMSLANQKNAAKKASMEMKDMVESVDILEDLVKAKDLEIQKLAEGLKAFEASTSNQNIKTCENFGSANESGNNSSVHGEVNHETTSLNYEEATSSRNYLKCDECDYTGDAENLNEHSLQVHSVRDICCEFCDFRTITLDEMNNHKKEKHGVICECCGLTYIGEQKLRTHMCRKHVPNPDYMDMYVKNWFVRNSCIPVFSKRLKKEIILLHSEHCWDGNNFCSEIPENINTSEKSILDDNGLLHGLGKKSDSVRSDGSICWLAVRGLQLGKMDWYQII